MSRRPTVANHIAGILLVLLFGAALVLIPMALTGNL